MKLKRLTQPDFPKLNEMLEALKGLLEGRQDTDLTIEELLAFQDHDGSFKLLDSYHIPSDARVDFCHVPTFIGAAILMKAYLRGYKCYEAQLENALYASLKSYFWGHGYEAERGRINALKIFIKGGMRINVKIKMYVFDHLRMHVFNHPLV